MKTWEDLKDNENDKLNFVRSAISNYKTSPMYLEARTGYEYFCKRNTTIIQYQKLRIFH